LTEARTFDHPEAKYEDIGPSILGNRVALIVPKPIKVTPW